ncbi:Immunity protein 50 [Stigmatella aurantiaca]|uniref:Immunity protein 50 n=1 Tax=Stigmatella aurantiaca TaxID=41 RepID=A0A1H7JY34_STIAU|nr:Imm50 family immunity protein [Stigmatella aurantiaca]SEK79601.1 Immunity protein 50 [Stigmatella aurantiaca]
MSTDWIALAARSEFLRRLFPESPPLQGVRILEVGFHEDGSRVMLRFNLNAFPRNPPRKWAHADDNTVQVRLAGLEVEELEMRGWTTLNLADIRLEPSSGSRVVLSARAEGFFLRCSVSSLYIEQVSAYQQVQED